MTNQRDRHEPPQTYSCPRANVIVHWGEWLLGGVLVDCLKSKWLPPRKGSSSVLFQGLTVQEGTQKDSQGHSLLPVSEMARIGLVGVRNEWVGVQAIPPPPRACPLDVTFSGWEAGGLLNY